MSSTSALNSLLSSSSNTGSNIDISNILAAVAGAQTPGIDVSSAVAAAVYAARAPERVWQGDLTTLSSQASDLQNLQSATTTLQGDMQSLNSLTGPLSARTVTSSDTNSVTATAASGTTIGNHVVTVSKLATTGSWYSDEQTSASSTLASGSFTLTTALGSTATITTGSGRDATLSDVVSDINGQNLGVTASIVSDASGSRLSLVSNSSGSVADFSVTSSGVGFTQAAAGANASLTVDGVPISSASNTVSSAINGVTLNLLAPTTTGSPANLAVASDTTQVSTAVNKFVTDYNSAISLLNEQYTFSSSTSTEGDLASDPTVLSLQQTLDSIASYSGTSASSAVNSLSDLGISVGTDGTLSVDTSTLNSMLTNDPNDVQNFLQGSSLNGFANSSYSQLENFTEPSNGAFTVDLKSLSAQSSSLTVEVNDFETNYITPLQTQLTTSYTNAEEALQSLPTQMAQLQNELGNNTSSSKG